jgi:DNA-binding LacI/PurR family transcriptional regulator
MSRRVGIKEIARRAAVAPSTVSRVMNNHPDVSPDTFQKVKAVIDELGFTPNAAARSLASRRSHTLALVTSNIEVYPKMIFAEIEEEARKRGYKLFVTVINTAANPPLAQDGRLLDDLISYQVDGIIWSVADNANSYDLWHERLRDMNIPVVYISSRKIDALTFISVNNHEGGYLATRHLIEQGYRHIGMISGPSYEIPCQERGAGWVRALVEAGMPPTTTQIVESDWAPSGGEQSIRKLIDQYPQLDAVFVQNDQMAVGVLSALFRLGRRVPEDIGVVGFDNRAEAEFLIPPLTSVNHHFEDLGLYAVEEIDRLIRLSPEELAAQDLKQIWIQPELVIRQSSLRTGAS